MNSLHLRLRLLLFAATLVAFVEFSGPIAQGQPQTSLTTGKINVRVLHAIHEPEESSVSYVMLSVLIRGGGAPFVIPSCRESWSPPVFCMASLRRLKGKAVPVRKGLEATLGFEDPKSYKPVLVSADGEVDLQFAIDLGLLNVRPGELVRLAFWIWPDAESMKDLKLATEVLTPPFRIPVKPD
jgi:hypothetical protein